MILEYLKAHNHIGKENAVRQSDIFHELGLDRRLIRAEIEAINNDPSSRTFINFCNEGVYIVATSGEVRNMRARLVRSIERNVARLKKCDIILSTTRQLDFEDLWDEDERSIWK